MQPKSVLVLNEGYSDNLGDQAINESVHYLLKGNGVTEIEFQDFTKNLSEIIEISTLNNIDSRPTSTLIKLIRATPVKLRWLIKNLVRVVKVSNKKYDQVIIGGGQLILSNGTFPIAMFCWVFFLRLFGNKNISICGVGLGTNFSPTDKFLFKYSLKNISKIYLRDKKSQSTLSNVFDVDSELIYDVAFIHNKLEHYVSNNSGSGSGGKTLLGIITYDVYLRYVQSLPLSKEDYFETWISLLANSNLILNEVELFYTTKADRLASIEFKQYVEKKHHIVLPLVETSRLDTLISIIQSSENLVSARMHALILGFTYNRKIVVYPISNKLIEFKKMVESDIALDDMQVVIESQFSKLLNGQ